jgi:hypothetical protein
MGEERLQALIQESLSVATRTKAIKPSELSRVFDAKGPALLPGLSYWCALNGWPSGRVSAGDSGIKPPPPDPSLVAAAPAADRADALLPGRQVEARQIVREALEIQLL